MKKPEHTPDAGLDLEGVVEKYYNAVKSNAMHATRSETAAADITQDVFALLVDRWDRLSPDKIGGWIFAVLRRKLFEYFRKIERDGSVMPINEAVEDDLRLSEEDSYFELTDSEFEAIKERVLSVLSDSERALYEMYFVEGRSYEDICDLYSLGYRAAASRVKRIRRKLETSIKNNGTDILPVFAAFVLVPLMAYVIFSGR